MFTPSLSFSLSLFFLLRNAEVGWRSSGNHAGLNAAHAGPFPPLRRELGTLPALHPVLNPSTLASFPFNLTTHLLYV